MLRTISSRAGHIRPNLHRAPTTKNVTLPLVRRFVSNAEAAAMTTLASRWEKYGGGSGKYFTSTVTAVAAGAAVLLYGADKAECCGIVGFIGSDPTKDNAVDYLMEGLTILQNRGYDSAGIATLDENNNLICTKYASVGSTSDSIKLLGREAPQRHKNHVIGIAHTRWATHGGRTDENAHPHLDYKNRVALCHNGTIENSPEIKKELIQLGIPFKSETDTEVIVNLIGHYIDEGLDLHDALTKTISRLEGTWGLVIIDQRDPEKMYVARHGSPLCIGIANGRKFVASETSAFMRYTKNFIALKDDEVAVLTADEVSLEDTRIEVAEGDDIQLTPAPYLHWTIKEIMEQPEAVSRALNYGGRIDPEGCIKLGGLDSNPDLLHVKNLVIAACGTSHYASRYGAQLMRNLNSMETVQTIDAAELTTDFMPSKNGGLLVISQSGETLDVLKTLDIAETLGMPRFSIVNAVGSLIARTTKCGVYSNAGREQAVASTKAFVTQITALALIAAWFSERQVVRGMHDEGKADYAARRESLLEALHRLPTYVGMTLQPRTRNACHEVAQKLKDRDHMFVLGRGYAEPIAMEGALKIKEITYIHAEGYSGGALKHGPFALIEDGSAFDPATRTEDLTGTPIILLILDDHNAQLMRTAAEEVRARGAHTVVITDNKKLADGIAHDTIVIPSNGPLTGVLAALPLQLLAYELAVAKGIDPDKPKNLAKAVTVA